MCQESLNSNPDILSSLFSLGQVDVALFFAVEVLYKKFLFIFLKKVFYLFVTYFSV